MGSCMNQRSLGETKQRILVLMLDGETTAEALSSKLDMNMSVVRRHLEEMVAQSLVTSSFKKAGRGRPSRIYSISLEGRTAVSSKYDLVADLLTTAAEKDLGAKKSEQLYASAGRLLAKGAGVLGSAESLLPVLADFGFQPELRNEGRKRLIISKNCPIAKLAQKHPTLTCDTFHTAFLREALKQPRVELRQDIARGAPECIHEF